MLSNQLRLWVAVISLAVINATFKAIGPALIGNRQLPVQVRRLVALLPPALLAALLTSDVLGSQWSSLDWRLVLGLAAGVGAGLLRAPLLVSVGVAMACTVALRLTS